jgi:hypothetical protein
MSARKHADAPGGARRASAVAACAGAAVLASLLLSAPAANAAAGKEACALVPPAEIAADVGLPHAIEMASATPDTGSGGRLTRCRVTAWKGSKSRATVAAGRRARLSIETVEEDAGSPFAANWDKQGASETRALQEERLEEESMFGSGYYTRSEVGYALWDRKHAASLTFNTTQNGIRNLFATWRNSEPTGRSVTVNMYVDESDRAFAEINRIAEAAVPAFAIVPGEFGLPGRPAPEPGNMAFLKRFHSCRGARAEAHGTSYDEFIVKGMSCGRAVEVMRAWLAQGNPFGPFHGPAGATAGWQISFEQTTGEVHGDRGHAHFVCVPEEGR